MDFNVADSVRCDIKVLVTKTRYTVKVTCHKVVNLAFADEASKNNKEARGKALTVPGLVCLLTMS